MQLIPVIDIKNGVVVQAKLGHRKFYQPINSALCSAHHITDVIDCFLQLYDFKIIYIADLNAITKNGNNEFLIKNSLQLYPKITFWVDSGYQSKPSILAIFNNYCPILGSECYLDEDLAILETFEKNFILSLDFSKEGLPLGSAQLFNNQFFWTKKIILMTLARVGSNLGVDLDTLKHYQQLNSEVEFIASGGIRTIEDIFLLKKIGIKKALCASALHNKVISSQQIKNLQAKKYPE